jgi:hypothetical protein
MNAFELNVSLVTHLPPPSSVSSATRLAGGVVVCDACGCRLDEAGSEYRHYEGALGHDARGCSVKCVDAAHEVFLA